MGASTCGWDTVRTVARQTAARTRSARMGLHPTPIGFSVASVGSALPCSWTRSVRGERQTASAGSDPHQMSSRSPGFSERIGNSRRTRRSSHRRRHELQTIANMVTCVHCPVASQSTRCAIDHCKNARTPHLLQEVRR
jgi:hypothetical protein